jgi:hypothetical protein
LYYDLQKINCGWLITWYEVDKEFYESFKTRVLSNGWDKVNFFYK